MTNLWVVECQFINGEWSPCDFQGDFASTNFYYAHEKKRIIQNSLKSKNWTKKKFRVREYVPRRKP